MIVNLAEEDLSVYLRAQMQELDLSVWKANSVE